MNHAFYAHTDDLTDEQFHTQTIAFLKDRLFDLSGDTEQAVAAAYSIAGLMATRHARALNDDNPINEILTVAGELEIHPDNAEELRKELIDKIKALT